MLLRQTRPEDLKAVAGLEEAEDSAQWFGSVGESWHETVLADPDVSHLVFVKQHLDENSEEMVEEFIGFAVLSGFSQPGPIELRRMAISPMQRGKGYGRQLLGEVLKLIADELDDRDLVWLTVTETNEAIQQLCESVGFEVGTPPAGLELEPGMVYMDCEL